jgi:hypothetical protein
MIEHLDNISVDISEKNGKIYCKVKVPRYGAAFKHKISVGSQQIAEYLNLKGIKFGAMEKNSFINNKNVSSPIEGTWVFKKGVSPKKSIRKPRTPKTTKITKE